MPDNDLVTDLLQRIADTLESQTTEPRGPLAADEKGWLTLGQAAAWSSFSIKFIRDQICQGKLIACGRGRQLRILKAHLDDQILRKFPMVADPNAPLEAVRQAMEKPPITRRLTPPATRPAITKLV